ncbi:hypothetical protein GGI42DRAFT_259116 [Trichoderma sp. SZMC 28013]
MVYASVFPLAAKPNLYLLFLFIFGQGFLPSCNIRTSYINMGVFSSCVALAVLIGSSSSLQFCCWGLSAHFVKGMPSTFHVFRGRGCLAFIALVVFPCTMYFALCVCIITKPTLPQLRKRLEYDLRKGSISIEVIAKEVAAGLRRR